MKITKPGEIIDVRLTIEQAERIRGELLPKIHEWTKNGRDRDLIEAFRALLVQLRRPQS